MLALINDTGILVVVLAVVVLFGASRLPKLARNLGEAGREFRKAHDEANPDTDAPPSSSAPTAIAPPARPAADHLVTLSRTDYETLIVAKPAGEQTPNAS
jgi:sec-independent protein translocase protein TatA